MASLITSTDVDKILQLDLLKTDFYHAAAYPSYLLFNPYPQSKDVTIQVGANSVDIYEVLNEQFIKRNVSGATVITIPAAQAISIVLAPVNGTLTYKKNQALINGVVVDYRQAAKSYKVTPRIKSIGLADTVESKTLVTLFATVDPGSASLDSIKYQLISSAGQAKVNGTQVTWQAPAIFGTQTLTFIATDPSGGADTLVSNVLVVAAIVRPPNILSLIASSIVGTPNATIHLQTMATSNTGSPLTYLWSASGGAQITGNGSKADFICPSQQGTYTVSIVVSDTNGGSASEASQSINLLVYNFPKTVGNLIASYPFAGNANDISGNHLDGIPNGCIPVADAKGRLSEAYQFDGTDDDIEVENKPILQFSNAITVYASVKITSPNPTKETFIISHGSWQNRWKLSIIPNQNIRWTLKTTTGQVTDIDSPNPVQQDSLYNIFAIYDGAYMLLYINGELVSYKAFSGAISPSPFNVTIGQILPGDTNQNYNFKGEIDEVRIYDYALTPDSVKRVLGLISPVSEIAEVGAIQIYPNPTNGAVYASIPTTGLVRRIQIFNALGELVQSGAGSEIHSGSNGADFQIHSNYEVTTNQLPEGIYWLRIESTSQTFIGKFIKL